VSRVSLRARLLVASLALVVLGLVVADVATYSALRSFLYDRVDAQLESAQSSVERALFDRRGGFAELQLRQLAAVAPGVYVQVRDASERVVVTVEGRGTDDPATAPKLPAQLASTSAPTRSTLPSAENGGPRYRVRISSLPGGGGLAVALPLGETGRTLHRLVLIEVLVTLAVVAIAAGAGLWLVRLGLRPLSDIESTAELITSGDLSQRVEREDERTEVGRLGRALNVMLQTIDVAFAQRRASEEAARASEQRVRRFVGDASHELRTPVAAVRAYAELYRLGAHSRREDLARLLGRIEAEAERMGVLVDDLLLLTRLDEGRALEQAPVDLGALADDAVTAARAVEPDRPIELAVLGSVEVSGDRGRIRQVVDNLLANVRAHTPAGSPARVTVWSDGTDAWIEVADRGPGIDPAAAESVFERFYRMDPARSRDHGGAGLGLSIVSAIAAAHGGEATVAPRDGGGAVFRIRIPILGRTEA
jgi:two-component system OmpR family sensor kinase